MASIGKKNRGGGKKKKKPLLASGLSLSFIKVKPPDVTFLSKQERDDRPVETVMPWLGMSPSFSRRWNILG